MSSVFIVAGDLSGDLHAGELVECLRARHPELRFVGMGGPEMEKAGVEIVVPQSELAIGGLVEVATSLARIVRAWRVLAARLRREQPALVVLLDSGDFNIPFARRARRLCSAPILYYIAPQVWAWRRGRARKLARRVDRIAAIFPFELELYRRAGAQVEHVGHPLVGRMRALRDSVSVSDARARLDLAADRPWVALLPGSRRNEVAANLPIQLATARAVHARDPRVGFALALAPSIDRAQADAAIAGAGLPALLALEQRLGQTHELLRACDVALLKPGTGTLEATLLDCPMVVMGRMHPLSGALLRSLVRVPHWAMPNLIAGREVVPEFLQSEAQPERMAEALIELLAGRARESQRRALAEIRETLGSGGATERVASIAEALLATRAA